jgi:heme exporter protein B
MSAWRAIMAIVAKDVAAELRSKEALSTLLIFALMIVVVFNFAFELRVENVRQIAPGVLWVAFTFAGILALNRSFVVEREEGCIEGLRLTPVDRGAIYLGKFLGNTLFLLVTEACILPIFAVLFDVSVLNPVLWLIMVLGTVGFVAVGTLFAAMAVNTRAREAMLPLLLFPIAQPRRQGRFWTASPSLRHTPGCGCCWPLTSSSSSSPGSASNTCWRSEECCETRFCLS